MSVPTFYAFLKEKPERYNPNTEKKFSSTRLAHSFYKNHFKKNVQSEICQKTKNQEKKIKNMLGTYRKNNLFFNAFTFQNPENLNYTMSYMESERM